MDNIVDNTPKKDWPQLRKIADAVNRETKKDLGFGFGAHELDWLEVERIFKQECTARSTTMLFMLAVLGMTVGFIFSGSLAIAVVGVGIVIVAYDETVQKRKVEKCRLHQEVILKELNRLFNGTCPEKRDYSLIIETAFTAVNKLYINPPIVA